MYPVLKLLVNTYTIPLESTARSHTLSSCQKSESAWLRSRLNTLMVWFFAIASNCPLGWNASSRTLWETAATCDPENMNFESNELRSATKMWLLDEYSYIQNMDLRILQDLVHGYQTVAPLAYLWWEWSFCHLPAQQPQCVDHLQ